MTRYIRPDMANVWASEALVGDIEAPSDAKIRKGWESQIPPHEWENFIQRRQDEALAYALQTGIPEWSNTTSYFLSPVSYVQGSNGRLYRALTDNVGVNPVTDSGVNWRQAFNEFGSEYSVSTGTANNYILTFSNPYTAITEPLLLRFKAVASNTGASTLTVDGISRAILGGANQALQGGEIVINNIITVIFIQIINSWVIISSTGGNVQVPDATQSRHAINYSQFQTGIASARSAIYANSSRAITPGTYFVDTTAGGFTLTLPTSPSLGDSFTFVDANNTWGDINWILAPGSNTFEGVAGNLEVDVSDQMWSLIFRNSRWEFV